MKKVFLILALVLSSMSIKAQHFEIDTLSMTGKISERINFVFLSDGYTQKELGKFVTDVRWMMDALFAKPPYSRYRNYFNCFAIKVPSEVSGAANHPDSLINNYFGSTFNYAGIWRLVVPTRSDRINKVLADNFPAYDQVFMIVNDNRYGGSGGWVATSTVNTDGPEICIHELGHSFGGLSDEYWVGDNYARENTNMTREADPEKVKWKRWLDFNSTGIYPHEESPTWFRPHQNCEMRYLNRNFCSVCREQIVGKILGMTSPILGYSPEDGYPGVISDTIFRISLMSPSPNTLKTWWELNQNLEARQTDSLRLPIGRLLPGMNNLTCYILDTTSYIRDPSHPTVHLNKVVWNIKNLSSGTEYEVYQDQATLSVYPNPASGTINLTYKAGAPSRDELNVRLVDASGKSMIRSFTIRINGPDNRFQVPLPRRQLPAGLYYLIVQSAGQWIRIPVVIAY